MLKKEIKKFWDLNKILAKIGNVENVTVSPKLDGVGAYYDKTSNSLVICRSSARVTTFSIKKDDRIEGFGELVLNKEFGNRRDVVGLINRKFYDKRHDLLEFINYKRVEKLIKLKDLKKYIEQQKDIDFYTDGVIIERKYAFKFEGPKGCGTIDKITKQIGKKTGKISYIAWLKQSIKLNEITVKKVNLSTNKSKYKVGDHVIIELKGQTVPIIINKENI